MYEPMKEEINKSNSENRIMSQDYDIWLNKQREDIFDANEACDSTESCNQCSKVYGVVDGRSFIPCNLIRNKYGVSIWDYKKEYRESRKTQ